MHSELVSFAFFHANMQNGFSLFIQLKLNFEVISWCLSYSSGFSKCMTTFLGDHLNLQNSSIRTNTNLILVFVLKPWFPKNPCENIGSCIVFEEKGNTPKNSWCSGFMSKGCARVGVLFAWSNNTNEGTS